MVDELDSLLARVDDPALRADLRAHIERIRAKRTYGLVFESHLPERVRLPEHPIRVGVKVAQREDTNSAAYQVIEINERGRAAIVRKVRHPDGSVLSPHELDEAADEEVTIDALIVIADFGEPVYPGLRRIGSVDRGGDKPSHVLIKGENHHVLEALQFTHAEKIDCIYIDPPYNSGAGDWKYDNNYVDHSDKYRHSKWLAFMDRRLQLAKHLLRPDDSVLIVTIDEKEYLRLGLLLEQIFQGCKVQMITTVISAKGTMRKREFSRVAEHIFIVLLGDAAVIPWGPNMLDEGITEEAGEPVEWLQLRRREPSSTRPTRRGQFYPIFVNVADGTLHSIGDAIPPDVDRNTVKAPNGTVAMWPLNRSGKEMVWGLTAPVLRQRQKDGHFRLRNWKPDTQTISIQYLPGGVVDGLASGRIHIVGRDSDGAVRAMYGSDVKGAIPKTVWNLESHNAESYGTNLLSKLIPGRRFDYPKSLHAVEDTLRFFIGEKPDAVVLDFFGGSGTTTHAVARLNGLDGGRRQSILITNNEVSAAEARALREQGIDPGDPEWEALGICNYITIPRLTAAFTGETPEEATLTGTYKFNGESVMAEGFRENVEFVELTYLDPDDIELDLSFAEVAPLLWLRAGARGSLLDERLDASGHRKPYVWTAHYGVLFDADRWRGFVETLPETATTAFVITDSQATFAGVAAELPGHLDVIRLYENYLTTFKINGGYS